MKQATGIQLTFITEKKLQKQMSLGKNTAFSETYASILNPSYDRNVHMLTTT